MININSINYYDLCKDLGLEGSPFEAVKSIALIKAN